MFGSGKRLDTLEKRLAAMEDQVAKVHGDMAAHVEREVAHRIDVAREQIDNKLVEIVERAEQDPEDRTRLLLNSVAEELSVALKDSLGQSRLITETLDEVRGIEANARTLHDQIEDMMPSKAGGRMPERQETNQIYQAEVTGLVAAHFEEGTRSFEETLLVGWSNPPDHVAGTFGGTHGTCFAVTIVQRGQYWIFTSAPGCVVNLFYSPLF